MANLSQLRRQRMLAFLEKMREQHKDDDEVLSAINEVENEINEKKYGLVWEEHSEEVEERMVDEVPIFVEDKDKEITMTDNGYNFLLEGDNLHSLHLLEKTHKEKIDVIYIDPPYNTGNEDFIYNDKKIGKDDTFRHSMWLSFMHRRLSIAKKLLRNDGVIFISIDDNEYAQLKNLVDSIFGEDNSETMIWHKVDNDSGKLKITYRFRIEHEYILAVYKDKNNSRHFKKYLKPRNYKNKYTNPDNDPRGEYKQGIISDTEEKSNENSENYYSVTTPGGRVVTRKWRVSKAEFDALNADNRIYYGKDGNSIPSLKVFINEPGETTPTSILDELGTAKTAGIALNDVFGKKAFTYPKPVELIKHLFKIASHKDDTILDFFVGSGTTGQAILELNKEDGGNRHFILCTNNENGICENVTYQRLKTIITGRRQDGSKYSDGIPADLKYYRTDFIPKKNDNLANDLITHIDEMIQLEYGVKIDKEKYISILSDEDADELEKNWANYPNIKAIYISRSVLLTGKQRELFETHDCFTIPDYYFREELREAGEA